LQRLAGFAGWSSGAVKAVRAAGLPLDVPTVVAPAEVPDPARFDDVADLRRATRARLGYHADEIVLGFVGRYTEEKGLRWLFESFQPLAAKEVRLACFGSGREEPLVRRASQESGGRIRDHGWLGLTEVPDVMVALDVLVVPSLALRNVAEQFGKVIIEAMLAGTPVVASRVGAIPEIVADGGELVNEWDVEGLTYALDRLITDKNARVALATKGLARAHSEYSPTQTAQRLSSLWEQSCGSVAPILGRSSDRTNARVAILMTAHNRRETTLACLESLFDQQVGQTTFEVFLVDDASTDGTSDAITDHYPQVRLIEGSGELFWSGAMALAQQTATATDPDFLLWLNDDVRLAPGSLGQLLTTHGDLVEQGHPASIVVGAMADSTTGETTYSGVGRDDRLRRNRFTTIKPSEVPQRCETMHGNLVLVPRAVYQRVGGFDTGFRHAMNDFDYGLRATEQGCQVWLAPGYLGTCSRDHLDQRWTDRSLPMRERARLLTSIKGLPPRDWLRFNRRHGGLLWPALFAGPYVRFAAGLLRELFTTFTPSNRNEPGPAEPGKEQAHRVQDDEPFHPRVLFVTHVNTSYRDPVFRVLHESDGFEFLFFSDGNEWYRQGHGPVDHLGATELKGFWIGHTRIVPGLVHELITRDYDVVIKCINGKFALPVTYAVARLRKKGFVLWTGIVNPPGGLVHRVSRPFVEWLYRRADAIVTYGPHVNDALLKLGVDPERLVVALQSAPYEHFAERRTLSDLASAKRTMLVPENALVLLYVGRLSPEKGLYDLIAAFEAVAPAVPDAHLVLVGDGTSEADIRLRASTSVAFERIHFVGRLTNERMPSVYQAADLLVLPSIQTSEVTELWGIVVNEAMAAGTCVVASDVVGAVQAGLLRHNETGLTFRSGNPRSLAEALHWGLSHPDDRARLAAAGNQAVRSYTSAAMAASFRRSAVLASRQNSVLSQGGGAL
jgi:glycosyltransferase involved in cell wall biosynthesis